MRIIANLKYKFEQIGYFIVGILKYTNSIKGGFNNE
jgi:hypothetical protein